MYPKAGRFYQSCHGILVDLSLLQSEYGLPTPWQRLHTAARWSGIIRKVILTVPGAEIADAVLVCGSTSDCNTDKVSKYNIELTEIESSSIKILVHSRVAIACNLKEYHAVGGHYLYICDAEQVYGDEREEALFVWNGYSQIHLAK